MVVHVSKLIHLRSVPTTDSTTGLLVNCHDTLVVQLSVSVTRSKGCRRYLVGDRSNPNSFFHDLVVCFDHHALRHVLSIS